MNTEIEKLKKAYWNEKTQAKFSEKFPRSAKGTLDDQFASLVELCAYNVDEYTSLEESVCGFLCE